MSNTERTRWVKIRCKSWVSFKCNLTLWDHILEAIEDNDVVEIDLGDLEELKNQAPSKKRNKRDKKPTSKKKPKVSVAAKSV